MKEVTIYGASDDLIEIEGDIREEIYANDETGNFLAFSDGTILSVNYGKEGIWRVNRLQAGSAAMDKIEATDPDGDYTDRVTLRGDIKWVCGGSLYKVAK